MSDPIQWARDRMIDEGGVTEIWILEIRRGSGHLFTIRQKTNGDLAQMGVELSGKHLGEVLMGLRAPIQKYVSTVTLAPMDNMPEEWRKLVQEYGNRAMRLYDTGYEASHALAILKGQQT